MKTLVVLFCVIVAANAHLADMCPPPVGLFPFHSDRFQGDWFIVSRYMSLRHRGNDKWDPSCQKINYAVMKGENDTRVDMQVTLKERTGQTHEIDVKGKLLWAGHGKDSSASEVVWKMDKKNKWSAVGLHSVLATDYESYAIVQFCYMFYSENNDDFEKFLIVDVLSREQAMGEEKLGLLKSVASGLNVNLEDFQDITNTDC